MRQEPGKQSRQKIGGAMLLGLAIGIALGVAMGNIPIGIAIGSGISLAMSSEDESGNYGKSFIEVGNMKRSALLIGLIVLIGILALVVVVLFNVG